MLQRNSSSKMTQNRHRNMDIADRMRAMKILFVENRQQTEFWEHIASHLQRLGHEVHWIVQNAAFVPSGGNVHCIPYPARHRSQNGTLMDLETEQIIASDRNINYFSGSTSHYPYYDRKIGETLEYLRPQIVFGEATLFHELLVIKHCKRLNIMYLQPTSCRYPPGRFSFYRFDTQEPFGGSKDRFSDAVAEQTMDLIVRGDLRPDYMAAGRRGLWTRLRSLHNGARIFACYVSGERFNTPSPLVKAALQTRRRQNFALWEELAVERQRLAKRPAILYPLHMQPEASIDVWGNHYRNQAKLIRRLSNALSDRAQLWVKPNPKSYYEICSEMLAIIKENHQVIPLPHSARMKEVLADVDLVITVTGTVAIESIFSEIPVATLARSLVNEIGGAEYLNNPEELSSLVALLGDRGRLNARHARLRLFHALVASSYEGLISNPFLSPDCVSAENLNCVNRAFEHVLSLLPDERLRDCAEAADLQADGALSTIPPAGLSSIPM
jgi:hypothetical protein